MAEKEIWRAEERRERVPSVDSLSEDVEEDEVEDEPVEESSESELEDEELDPSPKNARRRAMVIPRPEPELEELDEPEEEDEEEEEEEEPRELLELALLRAELRLARLLREPRRERAL